jgi:predicted nucleic acid-binding protein
MKRLRIFVDANVLFSACNPGSRVNQTLTQSTAEHEVVNCAIAIDEASRNLARKRPMWLPNFAIFQSVIHIIPESSPLPELGLPEIDGILLGAAVSAGCDIFITSDQHHFGLLFGKTIDGVRVLTPNAFANEYAR